MLGFKIILIFLATTFLFVFNLRGLIFLIFPPECKHFVNNSKIQIDLDPFECGAARSLVGKHFFLFSCPYIKLPECRLSKRFSSKQ